MTSIAQCAVLTEVRQNIDRLDRQAVAPVAERAAGVRPAVGFTKSVKAVAPLHPPSPQTN